MQESPIIENASKSSEGSLTKISVHTCENLKVGRLLVQPVVYVHVINSNQGTYLKKLDKNKPAVSFYETQRGDVDYIMPLMTHPSALDGDKFKLLKWEESFVLNESLDYLIKKESSTILFFEIMDFVPKSVNKDNYERLHENGMHKLAWAFLKLLGSNDIVNCGKRLRLQLYKTLPPRKKKKVSEIEVFQWWSKCSKTALQASLYVSIEPHEAFHIEPALRSMLPYQEETTVSVAKQLAEKDISYNNLQTNTKSNKSNENSTLKWSRKEGEPCKIPTINSLSLVTAGSCQILKFSSSGRFLVAGCGLSSQYSIFIYEIPSGKFLAKKLAHSEVIYDIEWCHDDSSLLSTSGDYSVKLWASDLWTFKASFVHPSYVYAAKFQPGTNNIICTACYDHILRVWRYNKTVQLLQELEGHNGSINSLCWIERKMRLISADSHGLISIWKIPNFSKYSQNQKDETYDKYVQEKEVDIQEIKITSVDKVIDGITDNNLFIFCGDRVVRLIDFKDDTILFRFESSLKSQSSLAGCCSPCGSLFFLSNSNGNITVWNTKSKQIEATLANNLHPCQLSCIDYHPYDHMLAVCSFEESILLHIYIYNNKTETSPSQASVSDVKKKTVSKDSKKSQLKNKHPFHDLELENEAYSDERIKKPGTSSMKQTVNKYSSDSYSCETKNISHLYDTDSSISQKSLENFEQSEKSEILTAIITQSGQFDVLAITDSSSKSDGYASQSSTSGPPPIMQRSSKRSQRRRKLKELNKT